MGILPLHGMGDNMSMRFVLMVHGLLRFFTLQGVRDCLTVVGGDRVKSSARKPFARSVAILPAISALSEPLNGHPRRGFVREK